MVVPVPEEVVLTILHTNDLHGRVMGDGEELIGLALMAERVSTLRIEGENVLSLDAGDTFHGTAYATLHASESVVMAMNAMGYDAMVPGNHDFNFGLERLLELVTMAEFPLIAANVRDDGGALFPPYIIKDFSGLRVAVFGLATPETYFKTHPDNIKGVFFDDPLEAAHRVLTSLEDKNVHLVIALTHLGFDAESISNHGNGETAAHETLFSTTLAQEVPGIDLIIDGHSHDLLPEGLNINGVVIAQAGYHGRALGVVQVTIRSGKPEEIVAQVLQAEDFSSATVYQPVADIIAFYEELGEPILNEILAYSEVELIGERELVRTSPTNLGEMITAVLLQESGADVAMINGGSIRSSIASGPVTRGEIMAVLPFGNYAVLLEVSGAELVAMLEIGFAGYPEPSGSYPHTAGLNYSFDPAKEPGKRTSAWQVGGRPLDKEASYYLATNDYLAAGGDGYDLFAGKMFQEHRAQR